GPADTLRIAAYANAPALGNPYKVGYNPSQYFYSAIFDTLVRVNELGDVVPWAAESWDLVDDRTWRFVLRPDIVFSNGEPLDAAAVVASLEWMQGDGASSVGARQVSMVASARAVDERTVEITTKEPSPVLAQRLAILYVVAPRSWRDLGPDGYA